MLDDIINKITLLSMVGDEFDTVWENDVKQIVAQYALACILDSDVARQNMEFLEQLESGE